MSTPTHKTITTAGQTPGQPRPGRYELSLLDSLETAVSHAADRTATLTPDGQKHTWHQVYQRVTRLAGGLAESGLRPGDRLAVALPNRAEYLECFYAAALAGAIITPLNTRLSGPELSKYIDLVDPTCLVIGEGVTVPPQATAGRLAITLGNPELPTGQPRADFDDLLTAAPHTRPARHHEEDPAALFATGGTTGTPKAVIHTHRSLVTNAYHVQMTLQYTDSDRYLHAAPMFHIADCASLLAVTLAGASHTFLPAFTPAAFAYHLQTTRATATLLVPTMVQMLLDHLAVHDADLTSWRLLFYGGAPMPPATLHQAMNRLPCKLAQGYGMTEVSLATALTTHDHDHATHHAPARDRLASAGRPAPGVRIRIADPAPDGIGEVQITGPNTLAGYWQDPQATTAVHTPDGWVRTGDLGHLDPDGYLHLADRAKDVIITGGENVYSTEVEQVLTQHPAVTAAAVIGLPDPLWGERVHAVLTTHPTHPLDVDLDAHARTHLAAYKIPRSYEIVDQLPTTGPGKVNKKQLRDERQQTQAPAQLHRSP